MSKHFTTILSLATALVLAGLGGIDTARAQGCLSQGEARQAVQSGEAVSLSQIRGGIPGEVVSAQLCRAGGGLVYVVSVLGHDGGVKRLQVDARSGAISGN
ncbi:hypothetical protein OSH11_00085 [Kaistia dalseonensis]|uniref:PepSY domain-containing protein n=1 Tax=Kaistia dalseonensis TaxID=410840 RepID=A0ABU0H017_9HYPH|nr:hypothetical protein [Kaistia dalseonensis]MCX5493093.1 hypothetical protein [Kaistia dalseonensis]MDQ0435648.1 hypothetical protein [Kaistia dalseonensis]